MTLGMEPIINRRGSAARMMLTGEGSPEMVAVAPQTVTNREVSTGGGGMGTSFGLSSSQMERVTGRRGRGNLEPIMYHL